MSLSARVFLIICMFVAVSVGSCTSTPPRDGESVTTESLPPEAAISMRPPIICFHANPGGKDALFEVIGPRLEQLVQLVEAEIAAPEWASIFAVYVAAQDGTSGDEPPEVPPIIGQYSVKNGALRFEPRFDLTPGLDYRAVFSQSHLDRIAPLFLSHPIHSRPMRGPPASGKVLEARISVPAPPRVPTTTVLQVYPTVQVLPENQLKFYLHFSAPMRQGEAYQHIHLVHSSGKPVDLPFLELDEELWDWDGTRLTVFIDPGRIKRAVTPHEELGPALTAGETYDLRIDEKWRDAKGNPLKDPYAKTFRVGRPDYDPPDPKTWSIQPPGAGTMKPLVVAFPEPLDHALLERVVWVTDDNGEELAGKVDVSTGEQRWTFTPETPWRAGEHKLVALSTLEDLAGNGIDRPFEVDVFQKVKKHVDVKRVEVRFSVE